MSSMVEARDAYTGGHLWRVAQYAKLLGAKTGLTDDELFRLTLGGFLHDVGKVGIPDQILLKSGPLTEEEFETMKTHPLIGRDLLTQHPLGELVIEVVTYHHEWIDGDGYPEGIPAGEISLLSRIIGVVDVFDAVTSARPYHRGMPVEKALAFLKAGKATQFDPKLVEAFLSLAAADKLRHVVGHSHEDRPLLECPACGPVIAVPGRAKTGDTVVCRSCTGKFRLHAADDTFTPEMTGEHGSPEELRPRPDMDPIEDVLAAAPSCVSC